jgi:hypothetical protein
MQPLASPAQDVTPRSDRALIDDALCAMDRGDNLRASQLLRAIPRHADPSLLALREALREQLGPDRQAVVLVALCAALWIGIAFWIL